PIIGTEVGGISDAISNYINGLLIEPNNPIKTAAAILELFNNQDLYNQLSINGISRIEKNFSIKKIGKKYIKIISDYYDY
ncbi:MAG: glycosyl transferase family 1, partial [Candidatus Marinimicrobia bacterium]|nr:glycosyl transferase family 1 [Candidatus Neomarinimicrobiota bacterium]